MNAGSTQMRTQTDPDHGRSPGDGRDPGQGAAGSTWWDWLPLDRSRGSGAARMFTRRCLQRWGLDDLPVFRQDALLVVSELVTNAHQHADSAEALRLRWQPPVLVIEVEDRGAGLPWVRPFSDDLPGGRGLAIVSRLVQRCQVILGTLGRKTVRVEMRPCAVEAGA